MGAVIIVLIQLYFWLHLRELSLRANPDDAALTTVAWIGLYPGIYSGVISILTVCILPVAVIAYGIWTLGFSLASFTVLTVGCLLALHSALLLQRIRNRI
jgi:hypothetical protein